jgi:hypothetical protein
MIPFVFQLYSLESRLYKNVGYVMRNFPLAVLWKFMKEMRGILSYICLLQSSIDYCARKCPITDCCTVYRGLFSGAELLVPLYVSMIGDVLVCPAFMSTSRRLDCVVEAFLGPSDGLLFEISLSPGAIACDISELSAHPEEEEVLIAAMTQFFVADVDEVSLPVDSGGVTTELTVARVKLVWVGNWDRFDIDNPPPHRIIE